MSNYGYGDGMGGLVTGLAFVAIISVIVLFVLGVQSLFAPDLIGECEYEMPRNEKCVLIAVPESTLKEDK